MGLAFLACKDFLTEVQARLWFDLKLIPKEAGRMKNIKQTLRASESLPGSAKNEQKMDNIHFEI